MKMIRAPMNQAERPLLVMKAAVTVAMIIMNHRAGQNCRSVAAGTAG